MIEIDFDSNEINKILDSFEYQRFRKRVVDRSMNRALVTVRKDVINLVREKKEIKVGAIRRRTEIDKSKLGQGVAIFKISDQGVPLKFYKTGTKTISTSRGRRKAVTAAINKGKGRVVVKGAFRGAGKFGKTIFKRTKKDPNNVRGPIKSVYSSSIHDVFKNPALSVRFQSIAQGRFSTEFTNSLKFYLKNL